MTNLSQDEVRRINRTSHPHLFPVGRGASWLLLITESGLYKLIMRSDKPEARKFQDWVTREVLPAIRKDGMYVAGEEKLKTGVHLSYGTTKSPCVSARSILFHRGNNSTEARPLRFCHCPQFCGEWSPSRSQELATSDGSRQNPMQLVSRPTSATASDLSTLSTIHMILNVFLT